MKKRVADIVIDTLVENGITDCFSVVGGGAMHLNNAFAMANDRIRTIYNHHEQACAMAAEGYAKVKGRMAAVCVTSGPGCLNTLNGVEGAYVDNTPMIIISGHPRYETTVAATGLNLRYRGVQEFNIVDTVKYMTKYAKLLLNPYEVKKEICKAINIAMTGRRGPVWIDIPLDVQGAVIEQGELLKPQTFVDESTSKKSALMAMEDIIKELSNAQSPCILAGSGLRACGAVEKFRKFAQELQIPVVAGALQGDILYADFPAYYGTSGSVGARCGNYILQNADVILVIGNSLSFKQTGFRQEAFAKKAKILMIDIEKDEARKPGLHVDKIYPADLATFFDNVQEVCGAIPVKREWIEYCNHVRGRFPRFEATKYVNQEVVGISAVDFWKIFLEKAEEAAIFALGNSSCIVPALVFGIDKEKQRIIVNYNNGSMGDDLPEATGIAVAMNQGVYCVTGDGSVMMNLQELQTIVHNHLRVKIIIFSNNGYGAIRRTCKNFFDGIYTGCDDKSGISFPDFKKIADAFEIPYYYCSEKQKIGEAIDWIQKENSYCILEIQQKEDDVMYPRLVSKMNEDGTFSDPELHDMYPFISSEELENYML